MQLCLGHSVLWPLLTSAIWSLLPRPKSHGVKWRHLDHRPHLPAAISHAKCHKMVPDRSWILIFLPLSNSFRSASQLSPIQTFRCPSAESTANWHFRDFNSIAFTSLDQERIALLGRSIRDGYLHDWSLVSFSNWSSVTNQPFRGAEWLSKPLQLRRFLAITAWIFKSTFFETRTLSSPFDLDGLGDMTRGNGIPNAVIKFARHVQRRHLLAKEIETSPGDGRVYKIDPFSLILVSDQSKRFTKWISVRLEISPEMSADVHENSLKVAARRWYLQERFTQRSSVVQVEIICVWIQGWHNALISWSLDECPQRGMEADKIYS